MQYRNLSFLPRPVSAVCLGVANYGSIVSTEASLPLMDRFWELGGNIFDTARVYGNWGGASPRDGLSEEFLASWLRSRGLEGKAIVMTKGAHYALDEARTRRVDAKHILEDHQKSADILGYVDVYLLHRDDENTTVAEIMETLDSLVKKGYVGALGASNWTCARIREANDYAETHGLTPFSLTEPQYSLAMAETYYDDTLVGMDGALYQYQKARNMACTPYTSQAGGYFPKLLKGGLDAVQGSDFDCPASRAMAPRVQKIMEETGLSANAVGTAYLMGQPFPVIPIVGANRMESLEVSILAADAVLTPEQIEYICPSARYQGK